MPETADPAPPSASSNAPISQLFEVAGGFIALAGLLPVVGIVVRWFAFALDGHLRDATFLAPYLPGTDLAFLGGQQLLGPPTTILALALFISRLAFASHMARVRAIHRFRAGGRRIEEQVGVSDELISQVAREAVVSSPRLTRIESLRQELKQSQQELQSALHEMEEGYREADRIPDPSRGRTYPIAMFGIAFASRWAFGVFVVLVVILLAGWVLFSNFPRIVIEQVSIVAAFCVLLRAIFWVGRLRLSYLFAAALIALFGATGSGALTYRSPIGIYEWDRSAGLTDGVYAFLGERDNTIYVIPCGDRLGGVLAVQPSALRRVTFVPRAEPPGPSLLQLIQLPGSMPKVGALVGCDSPV